MRYTDRYHKQKTVIVCKTQYAQLKFMFSVKISTNEIKSNCHFYISVCGQILQKGYNIYSCACLWPKSVGKKLLNVIGAWDGWVYLHHIISHISDIMSGEQTGTRNRLTFIHFPVADYFL